jgi:hypothetical protein
MSYSDEYRRQEDRRQEDRRLEDRRLEDRRLENQREAQRLENRRLENQRENRRLEDRRLEDRRLEDQEAQKLADLKRENLREMQRLADQSDGYVADVPFFPHLVAQEAQVGAVEISAYELFGPLVAQEAQIEAQVRQVMAPGLIELLKIDPFLTTLEEIQYLEPELVSRILDIVHKINMDTVKDEMNAVFFAPKLIPMRLLATKLLNTDPSPAMLEKIESLENEEFVFMMGLMHQKQMNVINKMFDR